MTELKPASGEQLQIVKALDKNNVVVNAVAGSGKTTTVLHVATKYDNKKILLLTYNTKLRLETKAKAESLCLENIEIHTYHSFCHKYYDICHNDIMMHKILNSNKKTKSKVKFDIFIFDEAQDMTITYFELTCKCIKDFANKNYKICILGDVNQSIYGFNNSDARYIILADSIYKNSFEWKKLKLSTSFRLTKQMADFINKCVFGYNHTNALKDGMAVRYVICNYFSNQPYKVLEQYMKNYNVQDIFILAPSIRSQNSPVRKLSDVLIEKNIPVFIPNSDDEKLDPEVINLKLCFSSFHQAKGLERKVVLVFGFDESYFNYIKSDSNPDLCPNEMYVAMTRAQEHLILLHSSSDNYMPFLNKELIKNNSQFCEMDKLKIKKSKDYEKLKYSVTELLRHTPFNVVADALKFIEQIQIDVTDKKIDVATKTQQNNVYYENVSEITGTAIPAFFQLQTTQKMTIYEETKNVFMNTDASSLIDNKKYMFDDDTAINVIDIDIHKIDMDNLQTNELLYIANRYCAHRSGFEHKLAQIQDYNWLSDEQLWESMERIGKCVSQTAIYEKELRIHNSEELKGRTITGYIDCVDNDKLFEFKFVNKLEQEHVLQLAVYAYLYKSKYPNDMMEYYLYNIATNEKIKITASFANLKKMMEVLIIHKCFVKKTKSDNDFINEIKLLSDKYKF